MRKFTGRAILSKAKSAVSTNSTHISTERRQEKALRPAVVECYALDPDQGPGYVSLTKSKWLVNKKIMALNSKDIYVLRKDFEPDLRVADAYSSRISVPVHASSQGKDSTLGDDDEEDNEDDVDDDDVNEDDVNEDDDI